jgi:hypothetical protein
VDTMLDEIAQIATAARAIRTADPGRWQGAANGVDSVIVQLPKFLRRSAPVTNIRLVPDLPVL